MPGFELATPVAVSKLQLTNLLAISAAILTAMTGVMALALGLLPDQALQFIWLGQLTTDRYLLPLGFACPGGCYVMVAAATRTGAFRDIAATRISLSQIAFGLLGAGAPGLAIAILRSPRIQVAISWRGIHAVARRSAPFLLLVSWARLFDMAGSGTIRFVIFSACYSSESAGFMFLTERVIARPLLIVSSGASPSRTCTH